MPTVKSSIVINGPIDKVYECAKDIERFPEFMPDVKSVNIIERNGSVVVSEWTAYIPDFKMTNKWVEEDHWDDEAKVCDFKLVKGDFDSYSGKWTFTEENGQTAFDSVVDYEYNIPMIGALIKGIVHKLFQKNVDHILANVKAKVEGS